jgi:sporulation protein YlmC with PRC-barrel domain
MSSELETDMLKRRMVVGVFATACCIAPALAQTSAPPASAQPGQGARDQGSPTPEARPGPFISQSNQYVRASKLTGVEVIGADNTRIGETEEILLDTTGRIAGVVIGIGGFLGIGEKRVAVPFDKILWNYGDVARATAPSASVSAPPAPGAAPSASASAEKMPGANISNEVLNAPEQRPSVTVTPATGPVTTGTAGQPAATRSAMDPGRNPVRAVVLLSKAEFQNAPGLDDNVNKRERTNATGSPAGGNPPNAPKQ